MSLSWERNAAAIAATSHQTNGRFRGHFVYWWRWRESNSRPEALHSQDYMLSLVIWISPFHRRRTGYGRAGSVWPGKQDADAMIPAGVPHQSKWGWSGRIQTQPHNARIWDVSSL